MGVPANATKLQDYAVVIGVDYPSGTLRGLRGTLNDAAAFTEWLKSPRGGNVPKDNIRVLRSPRGQRSAKTAKPVQEQIDLALGNLGVSLSKKPAGRRLYFYFTGHGFGADAEDVCMLMAHATNNTLNLNLGLREYRNFFQEHGYFQEVVFILDCCREPIPPPKGVVPQPPTWTVDADDPPPIVSDLVILAAANGKKAHETTDPKTGKPRGLFTLALLDVLGGDPAVDTSNLKFSLIARMRALAASNGGTMADQWATVELRDNRDTALLLRPASPAATASVAVRIVAPAGAKGDLVVLEGTTKEIARRPTSEATEQKSPWLVELSPATWYAVRHDTNAASPPLFAVIDWVRLEATKKDGQYVFVFPNAQ